MKSFETVSTLLWWKGKYISEITKLLKAIKREPINWAHPFINYVLRLKDVHWLHWLYLRYYIMGKHKLHNVTSEPYQGSSRHVSSFAHFGSVLIYTYIIYIIYKLYYIYTLYTLYYKYIMYIYIYICIICMYVVTLYLYVYLYAFFFKNFLFLKGL